MSVIEQSKVLYPEQETITFRIKRVPKELVISLKSKPVWEFFKSLTDPADPTTVSRKWGNIEMWKIPPEALPFVPDATFDKIGEGLFTGEGNVVNMSFLRATKLGEGLQFRFAGGGDPKQFPTRAIVRSFEIGFLEAATTLCENYILEYNSAFELTTRRVVEDGDTIRFHRAG